MCICISLLKKKKKKIIFTAIIKIAFWQLMAADVLMIHEVWFYSHMYDGQLETVRPEQTKCLKSILTFHMD